MANIVNKHPQNVSGKFFVDTECIDCDLCRQIAPDNFGRNDSEGFSMVIKQPTTGHEELRCQKAANSCPVDAIGMNG